MTHPQRVWNMHEPSWRLYHCLPSNSVQYKKELYTDTWTTILYNCNISGHWLKDCYSKGGLMNQKEWAKKGKKEDKDDEKDKEKGKSKGSETAKKSKDKGRSKWSNKKANQAVANESDESNNHSSDSSLSTYLASNSPHSCFGWILDSGATNHICTEWTAFATFVPTNDSIKGIVKNGPDLEVHGTSTMLINVSVNGRPDQVVKLLNVSYCLNVCDNLMSKSCMDHKGIEIMKRNGHITIKNPDGNTIMEGQLCGNLYEINSTIAPPLLLPSVAFTAHSAPNLDLWHTCLRHISLKSLQYLNHHNLVDSMDL